jgi:hypothetical protein
MSIIRVEVQNNLQHYKTHGSKWNRTNKYLVRRTDCLETINGEVLRFVRPCIIV